MKRFLSAWPFLVLLILAFFVLTPALPLRGSLGNIDWHIPPFSDQIKEISLANFFVWNDKYLLTGLPMPNPPFIGWFFTTGLGILPFNGEILSFANHFFILFLAGAFSFLFLNHFFKNKLAALVGAVFYMFSPPVFNWFHIGFIFLLYSYALLPLALLLFVKATAESIKWNYVVAAGLIYGIIGSIQTQSLFIWAMLFVGYAFVDLVFNRFSRNRLKIYCHAFLLLFIIVFLINFYWILQIIIGNSPITQESSQQVAETMLRLNSVPDFFQGFRLLGFHDPQYEEVLSGYGFWGSIISLVLVSLAWMVVLLKLDKKIKKLTSFFLLIYIVSVSLTLGYNAISPISDIYGFFVKNSLIGLLFRGSYKFWLLGTLAFTFLLAVAFDWLTKMSKYRILNAGVCFITVSLLMIPFYFNFVKSEEPYEWPTEYKIVNNWLSKQPGDFKAVYLPSETYIFLKDKKTHVIDFPNVTSTKTGSLGAANTGITGNSFISFLSFIINEGNYDYLGKILGREGIKYVIFQDNVIARSWEILSQKGPVEIALKERLDNQKDLEKKFEVGSLTLYENKNFQPLVYFVTRPQIISGDFTYLLDIPRTSENEEADGLIFLDQAVIKNNKDVIEKLIDQNKNKLVLHGDSFFDLVFSRADKYIEIPFNKQAEGYFNQNEWGAVTNAYFFHNINYTSALYNPILAGGAGEADASASGQLKVPIEVPEEEGPYMILIKAYEGPKSGEIIFGIHRQIDRDRTEYIFEETINTFSASRRGFKWFKIDDFPLSSFRKESSATLQFTLESPRGENAVERVILIPKEKFIKALRLTENILQKKKLIISFSDFNEQKVFVPKDGDYDIYIKTNNKIRKDDVQVLIDGHKINLSKIDEMDTPNEMFFAKTRLHLSKGEHKTSFRYLEEQEVLDDPSFEKGVWSGVVDPNSSVSTPAFLNAELSNDAIEGLKSLKLTTRSGDHAAAVCQAFKEFNSSNLYTFSFSFQGNEEKSAPRFTFWQNLDNKKLPHWTGEKEKYLERSWTVFNQGKFLPPTNQWSSYEGVFEPFTNASVAGLCFFSDPWGAKINSILYDDVKIREVPFGSIILMDSEGPVSIAKEQAVHFKKVSSTSYAVSIKNAEEPFILVLSESYNPDWKLFFEDKQKNFWQKVFPVSENPVNHFKINGFANAWYIERLGDFDLNLEFSPQRYFVLGFLVSFMTIFGILVFLIAKLVLKKK